MECKQCGRCCRELKLEIMEIDLEKEEIVIKSWIENQDGKVVIQGEAVTSLLRELKQ